MNCLFRNLSKPHSLSHSISPSLSLPTPPFLSCIVSLSSPGTIHGTGAAGWGEGLTGSAVHRKLTQNWTLHTADDNGAWRWGQVMVYGSGGFVQQLNRHIEQTRASLQYLQQLHWMDHMTRAVFVEFSLYNTNTDLLAVFSFLFEFPVSERTQSSLDLLTFRLQPITGLDLQLQLTVTPGSHTKTASASQSQSGYSRGAGAESWN
uniref:Polycystin domain-containing protein n=1 Tax=Hucho hucho TaxID=62062 RepID=A0A4W5LWK1_9TELE